MRIAAHPSAAASLPRIDSGRSLSRVTAGSIKLNSAVTTTSNPFASILRNAQMPSATRTGATPGTPLSSPPVTAPTSALPESGTGMSTPVIAQTPGIKALVDAIMSGNFKPTSVTDPLKLQEINPAGTAYMPNFYYASDQTAAQLASLLGGKVVQMPPFGQDAGWTEPSANFIQLATGQTFNAADVAYYARSGVQGPAQLYADITQTINQGSAWTNYYRNGGPMPSFPIGYVGPAIPGMTYPDGMLAADGTVINPAMHG